MLPTSRYPAFISTLIRSVALTYNWDNYVPQYEALPVDSLETNNIVGKYLVGGYNYCQVLVDNENVRTLKCSFPPGVGHERYHHAPHFAYTLAGSRFRITDAGGVRKVDVPTGYHYYKPGIDWHKALNTGDSTAIFMIVEPK